MKYSKLGLLLLAAALSCGAMLPRTLKAEVAITFDYFSDTLEPYGEWIEVPDYGYCWRPSNVDEDWAPYTDGYWANTDAGWTWVSYEDWGGITYHYGRWARMPGEGWFWVPDYEWAPAWVSWRYSDDYVGWAPLPPRAHWRPEIGFSIWVDDYCDIGPTYYNFCEVRNFGAPALRPVIIDRSRNVTIIHKTVNITNITVNKTTNIIYNGGPSFSVMASKSLRPIQTLKLHQQTELGDWRSHHESTMARQRGNELFVIAPKVAAPTAGKFRPNRVAKTLPTASIDTGWAGVADPKVRNELHAKYKHETGNITPEKAPAAAPSEREIKAFEQHLKSSMPVATQQNLAPIGTPAQVGNQGGKKGKHGEALRPFIQPTPGQEPSSQAAEMQKQPKFIQQELPPKVIQQEPPQKFIQQQPGVSPQEPLHLKKKQEKELMRQDSATQEAQAAEMQKQKALQEQSRIQEIQQRKQQADQERLLRAQQLQAQQQQKIQDQQRIQMERLQEQQRAQEKAMRHEQEARIQEQQKLQMQHAQEQQHAAEEKAIRHEREAQAAQERQMEQARRMQEAQQRHAEAAARQMERERAAQTQQSAGTPSETKKHGKDKEKDKDSDR